jgi:hypothetical protein
MSHEELIRKYPMTGLVPGWYFRQKEKSPGLWDVEGRDSYGHTVSRFSVINEEEALRDCIAFAKQVIASKGAK